MAINARVLVLLVALTSGAYAQDGAGLGSFNKLFEKFPNFATEMVVTMKPNSGEVPTVLRFTVAQRNGVRRVEGDYARNSGRAFDAERAAELTEKGMSKMVMITNPTNRTMWVIFPALRGYLEEMDDASTNAPITLEKIGEGEVGGHPCVESKMLMEGTGFDGRAWSATDLGGFPVKLKFKRGEIDTILTFEKVSLAPPSEALFRPPPGYGFYPDRAALKEAAKKRRT